MMNPSKSTRVVKGLKASNLAATGSPKKNLLLHKEMKEEEESVERTMTVVTEYTKPSTGNAFSAVELADGSFEITERCQPDSQITTNVKNLPADFTIEKDWPYSEYIERKEQKLSHLKKWVTQSQGLIDSKGFFEGCKSFEDIASVCEQAARTYRLMHKSGHRLHDEVMDDCGYWSLPIKSVVVPWTPELEERRAEVTGEVEK